MFEYNRGYDHYIFELQGGNKALVYHTFNEGNLNYCVYELFKATFSKEDFIELDEKGDCAECLNNIDDLFIEITDYVGGLGGRPAIVGEVGTHARYRAFMSQVHAAGGTEKLIDYMLYDSLYNRRLLMFLDSKYYIEDDYYDDAFIDYTEDNFVKMCELYVSFAE